jgi:DNA-binding NarL/FixJ family response regulator
MMLVIPHDTSVSGGVFVCCAAEDSGAETLDLVRSVSRTRPTVVLAQPEWPYVQAAIEAGASACVISRDPTAVHTADAVVNALASVARPTVAALPATGALAKLSRREREALDYIAAGFTHGQTARRMGVTKATVDTFVVRIKAKLGVNTKAELTRAALSEPA